MVSSTRTRYAKTSGVDIAYQVLGEGPIDLLLFAGWGIPIECMDDEPSWARFQRRLASFSRLIRFDVRGVGLSDRGSASNPPTREQWVGVGAILRLSDIVYSFPPSEAADRIEQWCATLPDYAPEGEWLRADIEEHVRDEHSTYTWLLEPMLERSGFRINDVEYSSDCFEAKYIATAV